MEDVAEGVEEECEREEECDERDDAGVEELLIGEGVGELGVDDGETDGHGQVYPCLQEGDDLSTGARGSDDEHIFGITENGVIEENAVK